MIDWKDLKLNGMPAIFRALEDLDSRLAALEEAGKPNADGATCEVVADLGHGWRVERQPNDIPGATTVEDVERQMAGVGRVLATFERFFVHSPGYPADDGEMSGADELTDVGLTYRELHHLLADCASKPKELGTPGVSWLRDDWVTQLADAVDGA
jgi:hypothetical protein